MADKSDFKLEAEMDRKSKIFNWLLGVLSAVVILLGINLLFPDYFKMGVSVFFLVVYALVTLLLYLLMCWLFSYKLLSYIKHVLVTSAGIILSRFVFFLFGIMLIMLGTWFCYQLLSVFFSFGIENLELLPVLGFTNDMASGWVVKLSSFLAYASLVAHLVVSVFNRPDATYSSNM